MLNWLKKQFKRKAAIPEPLENVVDSGVDRLVPPRVEAIVTGDNPIRRAEDDALGREKAARSFASHVLALDRSEGVVVGVLGPWGSGKTSFVNLARIHLKESGAQILDYNPWMFSGASQLVESFFSELSAQLKVKPDLVELAKQLERYGEAFSGLGWIPIVGPWFERVKLFTKLLGSISNRKGDGIGILRTKVEIALKNVASPIVVVLDDIDRLSTTEIRDIFKLVRLTARFPNIVYILAFDRVRVEKALEEQNIPGRDYLEKILQIGHDLSVVPEVVLQQQVFLAINDVISKIEHPGHFKEDVWPDIFVEIIRPLIKNMRDVRRYAAAINGTVRDLEGQISLVDVLALEAVRVFLPDVFREMCGAVEGLTTTSGMGIGGHQEPSHLKQQVELVVNAGGQRADVVRALIERLFPGGARHAGGTHFGDSWKGRWLRDRRVAHEDVFRLYLERVVGEGLQAFNFAEQAWARMADQTAFNEFLRGIDAIHLQEVIEALMAYEDKYQIEHVVPGVVVLLNILPEIPERKRGMMEFGPRITVGRVVYHLLKKINDERNIEEKLTEILPMLTTEYAKLQLINIVGHKDDVGEKLVSEAFAIEIEREWRNEVRDASVDELLMEQHLLYTLITVKNDSESEETLLVLPESPMFTLSILKSARGERLSQSDGSRAVRRTTTLNWTTLVELFGDEDSLRSRIEILREARIEESMEILQVADRYLSGWRPDHDRY